MLLDNNEVGVSPEGFHLHDYVMCRLDLQSIERSFSPDLAIFAVITLGDPGNNGSVRGHTNSFALKEIPEYQTLYDDWKRLARSGRCEVGFFEYLLSYLRSQPEIRLAFSVEGGQLKGFALQLGAYAKLPGLFPKDVDVLSIYFAPSETVED